MHSFTYNAKEYRSLAICCKELGISYQKVRRLCRHYKRAHDNPEQAIKWCLGVEYLSNLEPKTFLYEQDQNRANLRQMKFKERIFNCISMM